MRHSFPSFSHLMMKSVKLFLVSIKCPSRNTLMTSFHIVLSNLAFRTLDHESFNQGQLCWTKLQKKGRIDIFDLWGRRCEPYRSTTISCRLVLDRKQIIFSGQPVLAILYACVLCGSCRDTWEKVSFCWSRANRFCYPWSRHMHRKTI